MAEVGFYTVGRALSPHDHDQLINFLTIPARHATLGPHGNPAHIQETFDGVRGFSDLEDLAVLAIINLKLIFEVNYVEATGKGLSKGF